jgi:nucleoside-diphosphate-sugar epimerase
MILITGHKGFIGSKLFNKIKAVGIDIKEGNNLLTCELPKNIDVIYHLAAQSSVEPSWHDPLHDLDNIRITARLVKEYPDAKIIYANSCASIHTNSPYGFSKWASGEYIKKFHKHYVNLIFPNIYVDGSKSVVNLFKGRDEVTIFGDGSHVRDYVHVDDLVEGLIKAKDWDYGEYSMGSGKSVTVLELAFGKKIIFSPKRREDIEVIVPNTTPNWEPTVDVFKYLQL